MCGKETDGAGVPTEFHGNVGDAPFEVQDVVCAAERGHTMTVTLWSAAGREIGTFPYVGEVCVTHDSKTRVVVEAGDKETEPEVLIDAGRGYVDHHSIAGGISRMVARREHDDRLI